MKLAVKKCSKCKIVKPLEEFPAGGNSYCKICNRENVRVWAKENPAKASAKSMRWARQHRDEINQKHRIWAKNHRKQNPELTKARNDRSNNTKKRRISYYQYIESITVQ